MSEWVGRAGTWEKVAEESSATMMDAITVGSHVS
jgi:hypothetical protein